MRPEIEADGSAVAAVQVRVRSGLGTSTTAAIELGASPAEMFHRAAVRIGDISWRLVGHPDPDTACDLDPDGGPGQVLLVDEVSAAAPLSASLHSRRANGVAGIEILEGALGNIDCPDRIRSRTATTVAVRGPRNLVLDAFCAATGSAWWLGEDGLVIANPGSRRVRLQPALARRLAKGFTRLRVHDGPVPRPGDVAEWRNGEGIVHSITCVWGLDGTGQCDIVLGPWAPPVAEPRHDFLVYPCTFTDTDPVRVSPTGLVCERPVVAELMGVKGAHHRLGLPVADGDLGTLWVPGAPYSERIPFVLPVSPDHAELNLQVTADRIEVAAKNVQVRGDDLSFESKHEKHRADRFDFDSA